MRTQHWLYPLGLAACLVLPVLTALRALAQEEDEADLSVEIIRGPRVVEEGDRVRFLVEVTNHGPDPARNVVVRASGSPQLDFVRARCRAIRRTDDACLFREIEEDETVRVLFVVDIDDFDGDDRPRRIGRFRVRADAQTFDPEREDNNDRLTFRIRRDGGDDDFDGFSALSVPQDMTNEEHLDGVETASREVNAPLPEAALPPEAELEGTEVGPAMQAPHPDAAELTGAPPPEEEEGVNPEGAPAAGE